MHIRLNGFSLTKAGEVSNGLLPIRAEVNRLITDKDNDEMAREAFTRPTVDYFLKSGVIDFWHESALAPTKKERMDAVLGAPVRFNWEQGLPVVYGNLTVNHPQVQSMMPHLESGNDVIAVSMGGGVLDHRPGLSKATGKPNRLITKIFWDHLAVAPRKDVRCPGTRLSLVKAHDGTTHVLVNLGFGELPDLDVLEPEETLIKALEAGTGTDAAAFTGVQALQPESLENELIMRAYASLVKSGLIKNERDLRSVFPLAADGILSATQSYLSSRGTRN